jgi:flagellar motor component MotA
MRTITIHRALTELKTLDGRINDAISEGKFICANVHRNEKIEGMTVDEFKEKVQKASLQKVRDLINLRNNIKTAIVNSNAMTYVTINNKSYTVAQAIEKKDSITYEVSLYNKMNRQYASTIIKANELNEQLQDKLEKYLSAVLGNKENRKKDEVDEYSAKFIKDNTVELVDGNGLQQVLTTMKEEIEEFRNEVDAVLSESNALTQITIED